MKHVITILASLLLVFMLAGCGSKNYQVTTKSGQNYTSNGPLEYDVQSETYKFKNAEGREVILNQEDIEVIQEEKE